MITWNQQMTRYERSAPASRLRDFLVMAIFSLGALVAAWAFVQYWPAARTQSAQSETPVATAAATAPPQAQSAPTSEPSPAPAADAQTQALSEARDDLEQARDDLAAALARMSEIEDVLQELRAAPAPDGRAEPGATVDSLAERSASSNAAPATEPASADRDHASNKKATRIEGEKVVPNPGEEVQDLVQDDAKLADRQRPLPPPRKPASSSS